MARGNVQGQFHGEGFAYEPGSPHLTHRELCGRISSSLRTAVQRSLAVTGECRVLELGAGHGTFTDVLRDAGASVVVTEMSPASAGSPARAKFPGRRPRRRRGRSRRRLGVSYDVELRPLGLHLRAPPHSRRTATDAPSGAWWTSCHRPGSFVCWEDPTWYPGMRWSVRALQHRFVLRLARSGRGDLARGLGTRLRRLRRRYDETDPADMAEYHVVRNGVDQEALARLLRLRFTTVTTVTYGSTQAAAVCSVSANVSGW